MSSFKFSDACLDDIGGHIKDRFTVTTPPGVTWFHNAGFNLDPDVLVEFAVRRLGRLLPAGVTPRAVRVTDIKVTEVSTGLPHPIAEYYAVVYDAAVVDLRFSDRTAVPVRIASLPDEGGCRMMVELEHAQRLTKERDDAYDDFHRLANETQMNYGRHHARERELLAIIDKLGAKDAAAAALAGLERRNLETDRRRAADKVAEEFDYDKLGYVYEDDSGWEHDSAGLVWRKTVYLQFKVNPEEDTLSKTLYVNFVEGSAEIEAAELL